MTKKEKLIQEISILRQKEQALKILLNSGYGAFGSDYFSQFDVKIAESITLGAQCSTRFIWKYLKDKLGIEIIYGDTDSMYLSLEPQIRKICIKKGLIYEDLTYDQKFRFFTAIDKRISETIKDGYEIFAKNLNVRENTFVMERELFGDKGIFLGKKNYLIKVIDKEGVRTGEDVEPYTKGYETVCSSKICPWIIGVLKEYIEIVFKLSRDELVQFEKDKFREFKLLTPEQMFTPKTAGSISKYKTINDKGCQAHLKGAISYNNIVKNRSLQVEFPIIVDGTKIKYSYIVQPNKLNVNAIAYSDECDGNKFIELVKEKYGVQIDYNVMWEKSFVGPARRLTNAMNWSMVNVKKTSFMSMKKKRK